MEGFNIERFERMPIIGIQRDLAYDEMMEVLPRYEEAGLGTIEITLNSPDALRSLESVAGNYGHSLNIGAGTVCNFTDLKSALDAGASFIVMPIMEETVIRECVRLQVPVFPGAMTPTEIVRAWNLGATMVKVFPASALGPGYFKDVLGPLRGIPLLPTGGISLANIADYWSAGAGGFGIGGPLFVRSLIADKNWAALMGHFKKFADKISTLISTEKNHC